MVLRYFLIIFGLTKIPQFHGTTGILPNTSHGSSRNLTLKAVGYWLFSIELLNQSIFGRFKSPPIHIWVLGLDTTISYTDFVYILDRCSTSGGEPEHYKRRCSRKIGF